MAISNNMPYIYTRYYQYVGRKVGVPVARLILGSALTPIPRSLRLCRIQPQRQDKHTLFPLRPG